MYFNKLIEHYCVQHNIKISSLFDNERKRKKEDSNKDRKRSAPTENRRHSSSSSKRSRTDDKKTEDKSKHTSKDDGKAKQSDTSTKDADKLVRKDGGRSSRDDFRKDKKEDQPKSREQSRSRDTSKSRDQTKSRDQPRSRDSTVENGRIDGQAKDRSKEPLCNIFPRSQLDFGGSKMRMYSNPEMIGIIPREVIVECRLKRDAYWYECMRLQDNKKKATKKV